MMSGFVVVLREASPGVVSWPTMPNAERLMGQVAAAAADLSGGVSSSETRYLSKGDGTVLSFTANQSEAQVFGTEAQAQAAIDQIPAMIRPAGLSVEASR